MARFFEHIKLVELDSEMEPDKASVRLFRIASFDVAKVTPGQLVDLLEELGVVRSDAFVQLYYHDGDDFIIAEVGMEGWPESCCDDKCFKVWYRLAPSDQCSCSGTHVHNPTGKRFKSVTSDEFDGYRLLKAVEDCCFECVDCLCRHGVSANFRSLNMKYTPMDMALWQKKERKFTERQFEKMRDLLRFHGAEPL
jgi:hypothetical protein